MSNFKITKNIDLYDFQAWAGAVDTFEKIKERNVYSTETFHI